MAETENETAAVELDTFTADLAAQGFGIVDSYPANHRLRAEALATAGKSTDPHGHICDALIAETKDRLEAEAKDAKEAEARAAKATSQLGRMKLEGLQAIAVEEQIPVPDNADKSALIEAITAARAARTEG